MPQSARHHNAFSHFANHKDILAAATHGRSARRRKASTIALRLDSGATFDRASRSIGEQTAV
jgi:hypothetical protein